MLYLILCISEVQIQSFGNVLLTQLEAILLGGGSCWDLRMSSRRPWFDDTVKLNRVSYETYEGIIKLIG